MALHLRKREKTVFGESSDTFLQVSSKDPPANTEDLGNAKICNFLLML